MTEHRGTRGNGRGKRWIGVTAALTLGVVMSACAADRPDALVTFGAAVPQGVAPAGGSTVNGVEDEFHIFTDVDSVHAGPVTFTMKNVGTVTHEMLVVRTDLAPGAIPVDAGTDKFNEDLHGAWDVNENEISEYDAGATGSVTVTLAPGHYQLVCNVPGHYRKGMAIPFTVVA